MVPLSVLVSAREDAKAHAAREAQLNDARFNEAKAHAAADVWRAWGRLDAKGREQVSPSPKGGSMTKPPSTVTGQLKAACGCMHGTWWMSSE